jgi:hypothetical protein
MIWYSDSCAHKHAHCNAHTHINTRTRTRIHTHTAGVGPSRLGSAHKSGQIANDMQLCLPSRIGRSVLTQLPVFILDRHALPWYRCRQPVQGHERAEADRSAASRLGISSRVLIIAIVGHGFRTNRHPPSILRLPGRLSEPAIPPRSSSIEARTVGRKRPA